MKSVSSLTNEGVGGGGGRRMLEEEVIRSSGGGGRRWRGKNADWSYLDFIKKKLEVSLSPVARPCNIRSEIEARNAN